MSDRIYRPAWPLEQVVAHFKTERGRPFDPAIMDILLATWKNSSNARTLLVLAVPFGDVLAWCEMHSRCACFMLRRPGAARPGPAWRERRGQRCEREPFYIFPAVAQSLPNRFGSALHRRAEHAAPQLGGLEIASNGLFRAGVRGGRSWCVFQVRHPRMEGRRGLYAFSKAARLAAMDCARRAPAGLPWLRPSTHRAVRQQLAASSGRPAWA